MMRSKASKDSSRGFQASSEINFLISVRKTLPTFGQSLDLTSNFFFVFETKRATNARMHAFERLELMAPYLFASSLKRETFLATPVIPEDG